MPEIALVLPIVARGRAQRAGVLIAGITPGCVANDDYYDFLNVAAGQVAAAIAFSGPAITFSSGLETRPAVAVRQNYDVSIQAKISSFDDRTVESQHLDVCDRRES